MVDSHSKVLKLMLIPASCLVAWLLTEALLYCFNPNPVLMPSYMSFDPIMGMILAPDRHDKYFNGPFATTTRTRRKGFAISGPAAASTQPLRSLLILGDSFTYGVYVEDSETFSALLQKTWREAGKPVKVINAAVPGTGTDYALRLLRTKLSAEQPKWIFLFFHNSDFQDNQRGDYMRAQGDQVVVAAS